MAESIPVRGPESEYEDEISPNPEPKPPTENSPESEHEVEITPNSEPKPPTENKSTSVDSETNRIFVGKSLLNGTLPKETYLKLLNSKFAVKDCIKIMMLIAKCALRKMNVKLTETLLEAEAWRIMIRTSQKLFPAIMRKGLPEKMVHNIRVVQFRLDPQKMREH